MKKIMTMLLFITSFLGMAHAAEPEITWPDKGVLIDTRTAAEFNSGHIEGAQLVPYDEILTKIASLAESKDTPVFLYCRSGNRAGVAKKALEKNGYTQVRNLGGMGDAKKALNL